MGRLIPAGTGLAGYGGLGIQVEVPEGFEFETAEAGDPAAGEFGAPSFAGEPVVGEEGAPTAGLFAQSLDSPEGGSFEG